MHGAWGDEVQCTFFRLASLVSVGSALPKGKVLSDIYGHLNSNLCVPLQVCKSFASQVSTNPGSAGQWLNACYVSSIVMYHVCNNLFIVCLINIKHTRIHRKQKNTILCVFIFGLAFLTSKTSVWDN